MERKGDLLNQLAIISDLLEKINTQTKSTTIVLEMSNDNFESAFNTVQKKYGRKMDNPDTTFTINIGVVDIVFNKSNV